MHSGVSRSTTEMDTNRERESEKREIFMTNAQTSVKNSGLCDGYNKLVPLEKLVKQERHMARHMEALKKTGNPKMTSRNLLTMHRGRPNWPRPKRDMFCRPVTELVSTKLSKKS